MANLSQSASVVVVRYPCFVFNKPTMNFRISIPFAVQSFFKTKPTNHLPVQWYGQFELKKPNKRVVLTQAYTDSILLESKLIGEYTTEPSDSLKE